MPILTQRVKGRQVGVTCKGARTAWTQITLEATVEVENPQSASATYKEKVLDITDAKATIKGFLGAGNTLTDLPKRGEEITDLSFKVSGEEQISAELLDALQSGKWRVLNDPSLDFGKDSSQYTLNLEAGFID